ncbi:MAG: biotin--[acetyl-CoA-carboxylase] ligase [Desulfobacteraceae bacterium]|nr:biotin--[acetyl-CoA-carboxylase] ligase [Desulfobacteraceae bacterium]
MEPGIYILAEAKDGLFDGLDPERLAAAHPAWAVDLRRFGPWSETVICDKTGTGSKMPAWRTEIAAGSSASLICGSCSSTMDGLRCLINAFGLSPWDCLIALQQEKGRGQRERSWISPPGNLYVSWYWPDPGNVEGAAQAWRSMASLMAGLLTAEALESFGVKVRIKWPNDLLVNDRKVCGILVENLSGLLIVGIGLNLAYAPGKEGLRDLVAVPAASLYEAGLEITPLEFWARLAETGRRRFYQLLESISPEIFVKLLNARLAWKGEKVTIRKSPDKAYTAEILGLSADGGLMINREGKSETIYTGSIFPVKK